MIRFTPFAAYWFTLWVLAAGVGLAQEITYLRVNPDSIRQARKIETKAILNHDSLQLADAWYRYGEAYELVGNNQQAEPYFLKALRVLEPRGESTNLLNTYLRLSEVELRQAHFSEALSYAEKALRAAQHNRSSKGLIEAYRRLGHVREFIWNGRGSRAEYDSVLACYTESGKLAVQANDSLGIAEASVFTGSLFLRNNPAQAIPYLKKALRLFTVLKHDGWQVKTLIHLSMAYRETGRLALTWQMLQQAEAIYAGRKMNEHGIRTMLEDRLSAFYRATGQWEKALSHFEKFSELARQQLEADRNGALSRLNVEYETEKREALLETKNRELALRTQNLVVQQRFTLVASVLLLMTAAISIIFFQLYRKNQRISRQNGELVKEQNHRVKNNLQVISSLLSLQSKRLTDETAKKAIEESRLRVQSMAILHQQLYDGDELAAIDLDEFIRELIGSVLETYGYPTLQPQFAIDDITLPADKAVPLGFILNELTTNACKYAFPDNQGPSFGISCYRKGHFIELTVTDNGPGLDGPGLDKIELGDEDVSAIRAGTFGMQLIQAQVKQLRGTYRFSTAGQGIGRGTLFTMTFNQ